MTKTNENNQQHKTPKPQEMKINKKDSPYYKISAKKVL